MEKRKISTDSNVTLEFKECLESSVFLKAFRMSVGLVEE